MRRLTSGLTARAVLVTCAVALVSVLVTALVAVPVSVNVANREARAGLTEQARLVADVLGPRIVDTPATGDEERLARRLRAQGIDVYLVRRGTADRDGLPARVVRRVAAGNPVPAQRALVDGQQVLLAGRPIGDRAGIVLVQEPGAAGARRVVWRWLWVALLAGLGAGILAGVLLARRLARPIRNAATAAARLSAGDRGVRLAVEPPAEAEELARAMNDLATALATSEGRQRDFLLSVSHELRTPLTTIKGYAEALSDGVVDGAEDARRAGRTVLAEAERLDRLVGDLLALARLEAADFTVQLVPVDLADLVRSAGEAWRPRCATAEVPLRTEVDASVLVNTDPGRLRQVLDVLVENALRVIPAGAPLVVAACAGRDGGVVEVRDGGPGLADEDLAVAFDRGALHRRYQGVRPGGSGLGLALAAGLVARLGGRIEAGHAPEGGARFTVTIPYEIRTRA